MSTLYLILTLAMAAAIVPAYLNNGLFGGITTLLAMLINLGIYLDKQKRR